ncbi:MAG TPA: DUF929 family protein, partial [Ktedonobacterales bacterium]|nr:DUF929 family protein [Ktedonobacterales bacterium]
MVAASATGVVATTHAAKTGGANQSSRLASLHERERVPARRANPNRRRYAARPWWHTTWALAGSAAVVVALVIAIFVYSANVGNSASSAGIGSPVPSSVLNEVTHVPASVFQKVGAGPDSVQMEGTPPNTPLLTSNGLPEIFYVGGEYCPYCAAQRWGLVIALSRFGVFHNLHLMKSSHSDIYPDTNTFTFYQSTYSSPYIVFVPAEVQDRNNNNLQKLTSAQQQIFTTYDAAPYTQSSLSFPFVTYGNAYITVGGAFLPTAMQGKSWQTLASGLSDPNNAATRHIIGLANTIIAAICVIDQQQPGSVCQTPTIQQI